MAKMLIFASSPMHKMVPCIKETGQYYIYAAQADYDERKSTIKQGLWLGR